MHGLHAPEVAWGLHAPEVAWGLHAPELLTALLLPLPLQVYCGWENSECIVRAGRTVYLPPDQLLQLSANNSIQ